MKSHSQLLPKGLQVYSQNLYNLLLTMLSMTFIRDKTVIILYTTAITVSHYSAIVENLRKVKKTPIEKGRKGTHTVKKISKLL